MTDAKIARLAEVTPERLRALHSEATKRAQRTRLALESAQ